MKKSLLVLVILALLWPAVSLAENKIGVSPGFYAFTIEDPDGDTDSASGFAPVGLTVIYEINNKIRTFSEFAYYDFELDDGTDKIGQEITGYQLAFSFQRLFKFSHSLKFYAGLGVAYTNADFKGRHTIDVDGFLKERFDDRSEGILSGVVNIAQEWEISDRFDLGLCAEYQHPFGDGFGGLKGGVSLFYRF